MSSYTHSLRTSFYALRSRTKVYRALTFLAYSSAPSEIVSPWLYDVGGACGMPFSTLQRKRVVTRFLVLLCGFVPNHQVNLSRGMTGSRIGGCGSIRVS